MVHIWRPRQLSSTLTFYVTLIILTVDNEPNDITRRCRVKWRNNKNKDADREGICRSPSEKGYWAEVWYRWLEVVLSTLDWYLLCGCGCGGFICYVIFSPYSSCFLSLPLTIFFLSSPLLWVSSGFPVSLAPVFFSLVSLYRVFVFVYSSLLSVSWLFFTSHFLRIERAMLFLMDLCLSPGTSALVYFGEGNYNLPREILLSSGHPIRRVRERLGFRPSNENSSTSNRPFWRRIVVIVEKNGTRSVRMSKASCRDSIGRNGVVGSYHRKHCVSNL